MKILLVDDEKDLVMTLSTILEKWGHNVVSAYDGVGAQKILEETTVDVIISDLIMPNMDGGELLTWLNAQKNKPHFIIMSAYYNEGFIKYFSDQGITNIIGKPIQFDKLQSMLKKLSIRGEAETSSVHEQPVVAQTEHASKEDKTIYNKIAKDIYERLPEAKVIAVANPLTGTVYSTLPQGSVFDPAAYSKNSGSFYSTATEMWSSICGEKRSPKEILFSDTSNNMIYRNIVSPEVCIHVEATSQITHGLLRITVDNVIKETPLPVL